MAANLHTCLWFNHNAKEAADFYSTAFTNVQVTTNTPMVVMFEIHGHKLMGLNGGAMFTINPSISLFVNCNSLETVNTIWSVLIDGGKALMQIDTYPWNERYGWLQDKFGVTWQISFIKEQEQPVKITPSILFTGEQFGKAAAAIELYSSVFNNAATTMLANYPDGNELAGKIMYAEFTINNFPLIVMDGPGKHDFTFNEAVSFVVNCNTQEEIDHYWNSLIANGGKESRCGWLKDPFGISWQIVPTKLGEWMKNTEKSAQLMQAIMTMNKIDMNVLTNI